MRTNLFLIVFLRSLSAWSFWFGAPTDPKKVCSIIEDKKLVGRCLVDTSDIKYDEGHVAICAQAAVLNKEFFESMAHDRVIGCNTISKKSI